MFKRYLAIVLGALALSAMSAHADLKDDLRSVANVANYTWTNTIKEEGAPSNAANLSGTVSDGLILVSNTDRGTPLFVINGDKIAINTRIGWKSRLTWPLTPRDTQVPLSI
jgi:hypothetical protein